MVSSCCCSRARQLRGALASAARRPQISTLRALVFVAEGDLSDLTLRKRHKIEMSRLQCLPQIIDGICCCVALSRWSLDTDYDALRVALAVNSHLGTHPALRGMLRMLRDFEIAITMKVARWAVL